MATQKESEKAKAQRELDKQRAEDKKAAQVIQTSGQKLDIDVNMAERPDSETQEQISKRDEKVNTVKEAIINMAKRYDSNTDLKLHAVRRLSKHGLEIDFGSALDRSGEFFKAHQPEILEAVEEVCPGDDVSVEAKSKGMFTVIVTSEEES